MKEKGAEIGNKKRKLKGKTKRKQIGNWEKKKGTNGKKKIRFCSLFLHLAISAAKP